MTAWLGLHSVTTSAALAVSAVVTGAISIQEAVPGIPPAIHDRGPASEATPLPVIASSYSRLAKAAPPSGSFSFIDRIVDEPMLSALTLFLELSDSQRMLAQESHRDYLDSVKRIEQNAEQQGRDALKNCGLSKDSLRLNSKTIASKTDQDWENLASYGFELKKIRADTIREADTKYEAWWTILASTFSEQQSRQEEAALRLIRRFNVERLNHRRTNNSGYRSNFLFHDVIDLDLDKQGSALARVLSPVDLLDDRDKAVRLLVFDVLYSYESVLEYYVAERRRMNIDVPRTPEDIRATERDRRLIPGQRSSRLRLNAILQAVTGIEQILVENYGPEVGVSWRDSFYETLCPDLWNAERWPDVFVEWLSRRDDVLPEQLDFVRPIVDDYAAQRIVQRRHSLSVHIRVRLANLLTLEGKTYMDRLDVSRTFLQLRDLNRRTMTALRSILTPPQHQAFDEDVERDKLHEAGRLSGPQIHENILEALGRRE